MKKLFFTVLAIFVFSSIFAQNKGYEKTIEIGGNFGLDNMTNYSFNISMINGYRFNDNLFTGIGVGYRYTDALYCESDITGKDNDGKDLIPVFFRIKVNLTKGKVSPFFVGDAGYSIDLGDNPYRTVEGFMCDPAFGIDFKLNDKKTALYFMTGVNIQKSKYYYFRVNSDIPMEEIIKSNGYAIEFRLGIRF
ncbi:MAG: outer membrane beta-barrel protein [Bacteroidales bacterium]|nr:outer membrane beta-barrel protein [Bacteroidales bacterium]MDD4760949.1 outer membrane beta-barrel protein [Bacteroidaceae bacterium]